MMMHQTTMMTPAVVDTVMSSSTTMTTMMMEVSSSSSTATTTTGNNNKTSNNNTNAALLLPSNYVPGNWDVICQRGKDCHEHIGNRRFRICVENHVDSYLNAKTRLDKSNVISSVVRSIKESSNHESGGFIMKNTKTNQWYHVDNKVARDKAGNALRDAVKQRLEFSENSSSSSDDPTTTSSMSQMMFAFTTFPPPPPSPSPPTSSSSPSSQPPLLPPPRQVSQDSFSTMNKSMDCGHHHNHQQQQHQLPHFPCTRNEQFALLDTPMNMNAFDIGQQRPPSSSSSSLQLFTLDQEQQGQCTNLLGDLPDSFDMLMELPPVPSSITSISSSSGW